MSRLEIVGRALILLVVGGIGAAAGFEHTHAWAEANGQEGWLAWADAVVIESMAVIAALELRRDPGASWRSLPVLVLVGAFLLQMTAQVAMAPKTPEGWVLAATPALGFLLIVKLVMRRRPVVTPVLVDEPPGIRVEAAAERLDPVAELPAPPSRSLVEIPMTPGMVWLPVSVRDRVRDRARAAIEDDRSVTTDVLRDIDGLSATVIDDLVREINNAMEVAR